MPRNSIHKALYVQVIVAIALGVLLGWLAPDTASSLKPLADVFVKAVKMLIAPVVFCTVVLGIAGAKDTKRVGKIGGLALIYFEVVSSFALLLGLVVVNVVRPGAGMHVDVRTLDASAVASYAKASTPRPWAELWLEIVPSTVVDAFAKGEILQVLFLAVLFGIALQKLGERSRPLLELLEKTSQLSFTAIGMVMRLAPLGAFGAMAYTIGKHGLSALLSLGGLMATFYVTCLAFVFLVLGAIARGHGFSVYRLIKYLKDELLIVLGTSSSEAALPQLMAKLEHLGVSQSAVGVVVPTGYSFNLDGTCIYLTMAAVFIAQATETPLSWSSQLTLLAVSFITSKGAAAVSGSAFIVLGATLSTVGGLPVAGLALILGVDRFMSEARALTNLIGNAVATLVIARWTGELDVPRLRAELMRPTPLPDALGTASHAAPEPQPLAFPSTPMAQPTAE